ncbi:MAG: hypothetical protein H0U74_08360 [Bradymonadaceae bacterium]|nr:hypothetical protein [Lujinxingiaceae bacterium]
MSGMVATPLNYIGLFFTLLIIVLVAFYVWALVNKIIVTPGKSMKAVVGDEYPKLDQASLNLDDKKLEEKPVHTQEAHEPKKK